jgi:predicted RNA binding protein YcfA (HicA-like mRNA interferase family)
MTYRELTKQLRQLGCYLVRQGAGSHEIWRNPRTQRQATIPNHAGQDIPRGTLRAILRDLEIDPNELKR